MSRLGRVRCIDCQHIRNVHADNTGECNVLMQFRAAGIARDCDHFKPWCRCEHCRCTVNGRRLAQHAEHSCCILGARRPACASADDCCGRCLD